jgi:nitrite reductase/ring-hydroxylating ferredoxin subunit
VCRVSELGEGERRIIEVNGRSIGVFRVGGRFYALRNRCAHPGGPVCTGGLFPSVSAEVRAGRLHEWLDGSRPVIACPWHGWEFDLASGTCMADKSRRVGVYEVSVRRGRVVVEVLD